MPSEGAAKLLDSGWTFGQVPMAAMLDGQLTDGAARLLVYMCWRRNQEGNTWPSIQSMAADMGKSPQVIRRRVQELVDLGHVVVTRRTGQTNVYQVMADPKRPAKSEGVPKMAGGGTKNGTLTICKNNIQSSLAGVPANLVRSPKASEQTVAHRQCRKAVTEHFKKQTALRMPQGGGRKGIAATWWNPVRVICEEAEWDIEKACRLVDDALSSLAGLTISAPASIVKTVKAIAAKERIRAAPPRHKRVVVYPDGSRETLEL